MFNILSVVWNDVSVHTEKFFISFKFTRFLSTDGACVCVLVALSSNRVTRALVFFHGGVSTDRRVRATFKRTSRHHTNPSDGGSPSTSTGFCVCPRRHLLLVGVLRFSHGNAPSRYVTETFRPSNVSPATRSPDADGWKLIVFFFWIFSVHTRISLSRRCPF